MANLNNNIKQLTEKFHNIHLYIDKLNKQIQELKEHKKIIENSLINEIENIGLQNQAIIYQGKKIFIAKDNTYDTLSFKFLEQCLLKIYKGNQTQVKNIIKFIKQQRQIKTSKIIKIK